MFWLAEVFNGRFSEEELRRRERWAHRQRAEAVHRTLSTSGRAVARAAGAIARAAGDRLATLYRSYRRWQARRAAIRELAGLSDHILRDIGLNRGDIRTAVDEMLDRRSPQRSAARTVGGHRPEAVAASGPAAEQAGAEAQWKRAA